MPIPHDNSSNLNPLEKSIKYTKYVKKIGWVTSIKVGTNSCSRAPYDILSIVYHNITSILIPVHMRTKMDDVSTFVNRNEARARGRNTKSNSCKRKFEHRKNCRNFPRWQTLGLKHIKWPFRLTEHTTLSSLKNLAAI